MGITYLPGRMIDGIVGKVHQHQKKIFQSILKSQGKKERK
jgi:hypothetical protein